MIPFTNGKTIKSITGQADHAKEDHGIKQLVNTVLKR